jgi:ribonuclease E
MEMSRQRMRASVLESTMQPCPHCGGAGHIRSQQSVALHVIRSLEDYLMRNGKHHITVRTDADTALYILNHKRETLTEMEGRFGLHIEIVSDPMIGSELYAFDKGEISDLPRVEPIRPDYSDFDDDDDIVDEIEQEEQEEETGSAAPSEDDEEDDDRRSKKRRKRRRRGKGRDEERDESDSQDAAEASDDNEDDRDDSRGGKRKRRRSRGRRGGRDRRPFRLPDAEPVGPLADMIVAEAAEQEAENRRKAEEAAKAAEEQAAAEQTAQAEATKASEAPAAEEPIAQEPANEEAPKEAAVANDNAVEAEEAAADEKPSRRRATADTLDLDAEPVVTSEGTAAEEKPKRTGWWSRKGFF